MATTKCGTLSGTVTSSIYLSFTFIVPLYFIMGFIFAAKLPKDNKRFSVYISVPIAYLIGGLIISTVVSPLFGLVLYFLYNGFYIYDLTELDDKIIFTWLLFFYGIGTLITFLRLF